MSKRVVTLAHYYTQPEIQQMADKVGDSLELSLFARESKADIIVFASPSAVESFLHQAASLRPDAGARQPKAVAIGATTADALRKAGIPLAGTASAPTAIAIRNAVIEALT